MLSGDWLKCLSLYLQSILDHSGSIATYVVYRSTLTRFFAFLGDTPPDQVKHRDVLAFQQLPSTSPRNRGSQVTASTKNQRRAILSSFYHFASSYELPDGTPLFTGIIPTASMHSLKPEVSILSMSEDDLARFFAIIPTNTLKGVRDRALYFLYFLTSRRRSELCFLRWRDIEATIIIDDDGTRHAGHVYRYRGKGASREVRAKELPESGWQALTSYLEQAGRLATMQPDDYLFVSVHPGQGRQSSEPAPLHKAYITRIFKQYCLLAGLDPHYSLHTLRHSSARLRYTLGSPLQDIQHALNHASIATTDIYIRRLAGVTDKGARLLEARYSHMLLPDL